MCPAAPGPKNLGEPGTTATRCRSSSSSASSSWSTPKPLMSGKTTNVPSGVGQRTPLMAFSRAKAGRPGPPTVAKTYRLLHGILETATADELIVKNPCVIKGAGVERTPEREVITVAQVWELADAVDARYRALVLMAGFTGLRRGELFGLTRRRIDLLHQTVTVVEQRLQLKDGTVLIGPPKTDAGRRTLSLPGPLVPEIDAHLAAFAQPGADGLVFTGEKGGPLRDHVWQAKWSEARAGVGLPKRHFHDLRHVANTLTAAAGASTRELMHRMGHVSPAAALRYQHATRDRDAAIAAALGDLIAPKPATVIPLPTAGGSQ